MDGKIRLAIVEDSELFRRMIEDAMSLTGRYVIVGSAADGEAGMELLNNNEIDVALLDVALPKKDGLYILEELQQRPPEQRPICIMISGIDKEHITKKALDTGADYYILKPFDVDILIRRVEEIFESKKGAQVSFAAPSTPDTRTAPVITGEPHPADKKTLRREMESQVSDMLHKIQISTNLKGYTYIKMAVILGIENPKILGGITKSLYPTIARECRTTSTRVERAIRHAIDSAWAKGYSDNYYELLGYGDGGEVKPTNSVFITSLVELYELSHD